MALQLISDGNRPTGTEWMNTMNEGLNIGGKNLIRTLINRAGVFSTGTDDFWGEAYVDADGQGNSVNTTNTTAIFSSNVYRIPKATDIVNTDATEYTTSSTTYVLKLTFDYSSVNKYISKVTYQNYRAASGYSSDVRVRYTYSDASTYDDDQSSYATSYTLYTATNANPTKLVTKVEMYLKMQTGGSSAHFQQTNVYLTNQTNARTIEHAIPAGTFSATISKAFGTTLYTDYESGVNIRYKLQNASEDSGWLNCNSNPLVSSFTAFTSQPTKLIVELTPKSSSPTPGYPSIRGFAVRCT